jgi:hypothetical protein
MRGTTKSLGCRVALLVTSIAVAALAAVTTPAVAHAVAGSDRLGPGETLTADQSIAAPGMILTMQGDGNLVLYGAMHVALWASGTSHPSSWAVMQGDGNLVVYWNDGGVVRPAWGSGTNGRGTSTLVLQGDGNLVLYGPSGATWSTNTYKQAYALSRFPQYGWGSDQWGCLNQLWIHESNWNELVANATSGAYGIPQALPGTKMAVQGADWRTNPQTQIRWGEDYIKGTYGSPCRAWTLWQSRSPHWY